MDEGIKEEKILYKDHKGRLNESMATVREISSKEELLDYASSIFAPIR